MNPPTTTAAPIGGACSVLTRANAVSPGSVVAGKRANWELDQVVLADGGADGVVATPDNSVFLRQGIFIP